MSATRARRTATKNINYAREQEFSDEDLFEDGEAPAATPVAVAVPSIPTRRKKIRKPKSDAGASLQFPASLSTIAGFIKDTSAGFREKKPMYTEKGYDSTFPPIRERFTFMPEYEEDGTMKIELIVGRRLVDESAQGNDENNSKADMDEISEVDSKGIPVETVHSSNTPQKSPGHGGTSPSKNDNTPNKEDTSGSVLEYEYLVKYKGRSYLHLEWKTGADLESMNKSAKGIYRRYLKKLAQGLDDELENPEIDPSFVVPEKIVDEAEQEITIELTDKEILRLEKQRERELKLEVEESPTQDSSVPLNKEVKPVSEQFTESNLENAICITRQSEKKDTTIDEDWADDEVVDFITVPLQRLRSIVAKEGPYYPVIEGSDNPYRDGYVTEPPKKPRASYLLFQSAMRLYYQKRNPQAHLQSELMSTLGDAWRKMSDEEKAPFLQLANEEAKQYETEKELLEKAQKPNGVWQPIRRCQMVLDRLTSDGFSEVFLQPVDTKEFPDYNEVIDHPMDLGTVRTRLNSKKYQACEQFARDMRKIWNNCKIYNMHGSAIWYVADYMSKQFERLYHAWVLDFRERYIRWADPRARPWEHSCRIHDGNCLTPDDKMVLCDHCDAMYGLACLDPPLKKVPKQVWHCPDCKLRLKSVKGGRMLSAIAENAARKRAELGDLPKKRVNQTMYLVKWAGLGYEFCTWETRKDIANDKLISDFQRINKTVSDEPDLSEETINNFLQEVTHTSVENAGGTSVIAAFRSQLYAQTRAFQFVKFADTVPSEVCEEIGPKTHAKMASPQPPLWENSMVVQRNKYIPEVFECLSDMLFRISRGFPENRIRPDSLLPPTLSGEYDTIIPITSKGLMMNVAEANGSVAFLGYRQFPGGIKGPAEEQNLVKGHGDKIIAVDGISTVGMSFNDVISLLRESGKNKFAYMRFLESRYSNCDLNLSSVGSVGRYAHEELGKKFSSDRQRILVERTHENVQLGKKENDERYTSDQDSENGSEGSFLPESEDEDPQDDLLMQHVSESADTKEISQDSGIYVTIQSVAENSTLTNREVEAFEPKAHKSRIEISTDMNHKPRAGISYRQESTRSLALRLLDLDVGYSSDEAGDEEMAYFVDGVDGSFYTSHELENSKAVESSLLGKTSTLDDKDVTLPAKQNEFAIHGDRAKLAAAVALCKQPPNKNSFENFPLMPNKIAEPGMQESGEIDVNSDGQSKSTKRSTVKVEQISVTTNETIHVWANVEAAAATLQLPLNQLKQVLRGDYDEEIGDEVGGFKWSYALAGAKVTAGNSTLRGGGGKKAKEAWLEFREKLYDPNEPHIYKNGNRLRDYQVGGVNWLASTWYKRQGCILSDEMGLGKTVQIVCYIEHLYRVEKIKRPFLVVVPLSTIEHWRREFEGWTDIVCCIYHDRQRIWRDVMREYEWYYEDRPHTAEFLKFDVIVTTYDTLISDFDVISQIPFRVSVVDEAHRLRNQKGKLLECMREVSARGTMQYGFQSRVLMSGTPLQNDLTELWTLLNFIEPFKFADLESFQTKFGNMRNRAEVEALQKLISPYLLRRVKEDVAKDIPAKEETLIDVELTSIQKQYYRAIFEHNLAFLNMGATRQTAPKLMNIQMELRKVCNHPYLLEGVEHRESDRLYKEFTEKGLFVAKSPEEQHHLLNEHGYVMTSGKMVLLDKLLPKLRQEGHKILIFSQMVKMLDLISEYCDFRGFRYERLDGRVRGTERQKAIDRFEKEKDSFLFLLSTRAGGVGINLTAADVCIIFDSDWNPQNDVQAQARCHRIGQTKDVRIYRLITSRSFETEMFERASRKLGLEQAVLGTFEKEGEDDKPTQQEMEQLLKKGAYALLDDDNDEITREFCADDIESILAKRTRTRVVEGTKTASWLNKQGLVVSKSKFTAESGASLDMDDPLFWQKVMPDFVTPAILMQKLNDLQDEIEGKVIRGPGRGRGRGRPKKKSSEDDAKCVPGEDVIKELQANDAVMKSNVAASLPEESSDDEDHPLLPKASKNQLSRKNIRSVHTFISDLKSMMENILEDAEDEGMKSDEKAVCQKLLLTITVKEKIFNDEQRRLARVFLKRLEGDRRRRCRNSEQQRFKPGSPESEEPVNRIREEFRIVGKQKKKRKKRNSMLEFDHDQTEDGPSLKKDSVDSGIKVLGEDGYLHHSDSEDDWSDVAEDLYLSGPKGKYVISRKESLRRRQWGADDDAATVAGRAWPVFPRHMVKTVLSTLLEAVIKYDNLKGGMFSVPVPKEEFPEYYNHIKNPMDYGTMKDKLENGEYRSAQAMQKDFILILQNCRQFNASSSDIVKEAREQHLNRPKFLRQAALKHNLFLAEDGTVLEIIDDEDSQKLVRTKDNSTKVDDTHDLLPKKVKKKRKHEDPLEKSVLENPIEKTSSSKNKEKRKLRANEEQVSIEKKEPVDPKKHRIRIKVKSGLIDEAISYSGGESTQIEASASHRAMKKRKIAELEVTNDIGGDDRPLGQKPSKKIRNDELLGTRKTRIKKDSSEAVENTKKVSIHEPIQKAINSKRSDGDFLIFADLSFWKKRRESLDTGFIPARRNLTERGPWGLPPPIPHSSFNEIAEKTLDRMARCDKFSVFAEPVTEKQAPGYSNIIKNPMDFGTMRKKVKLGKYGTGIKAVHSFYEDFLLVFDNCHLFNSEESEVTEEAARILGHLPEAFAFACNHVMKNISK